MYEEQFDQANKRAKDRGTDRPIPCRIIGAPGSTSEELYVHVESLGPNARRGPCKWTPRPGPSGPILPSGGERAIMQFDTDGLPWIIEWWPYS